MFFPTRSLNTSQLGPYSLRYNLGQECYLMKDYNQIVVHTCSSRHGHSSQSAGRLYLPSTIALVSFTDSNMIHIDDSRSSLGQHGKIIIKICSYVIDMRSDVGGISIVRNVED